VTISLQIGGHLEIAGSPWVISLGPNTTSFAAVPHHHHQAVPQA